MVVSAKQETEQQKESEDREEELPRWWELTNIILAHFSFVVLMVDFEGRSAELGFVFDSIDMGMNFGFVVAAIIRIVLEIMVKRSLPRLAIADICVGLVCLGGIIYEGAIATDFEKFLEAETLEAQILRIFKCLKLLLLFFERKYYWKGFHDFLLILRQTLRRTLCLFGLWLSLLFVFAIMGHHIEGGRVLVNEGGQLDMEEGKPNRFNFEDVYHSWVFTLLDAYDEEWDWLMFKEYLGVNPVIVGWQMIIMFFCYFFLSKYLSSSFASELDHALHTQE